MRCVDDFGSGVETLLDAGARTVLGPWLSAELGPGDGTTEAVAAARIGFALREQELVWDAGPRRSADEPLLAEIDLHCSGVSSPADAVIGLLRDVVRYGYCGGGANAMSKVPGRLADARADVIRDCVNRYRGDEESGSATAMATAELLRFGYLLHRIVETRPEWFVERPAATQRG